jgi:hypothetical protein
MIWYGKKLSYLENAYWKAAIPNSIEIRPVVSEVNSVAWIRERTIPTERPPVVGEVSATWSVWRIPTAVFSAF